jgi:hypothetical protein
VSALNNEFCTRLLLKQKENVWFQWVLVDEKPKLVDKLCCFDNINPTDTSQEVNKRPGKIKRWQWHFTGRQIAVEVFLQQVQL